MTGRTLYATSDRKRFFLVPDGAALPPGDLVVRTLTGAKLEADSVALDVYEVPEAEAMRAAQEVLGDFAEKARAVVMSAAKALSTPPRLDPDAVAAREARVAEALHLGREQLRGDPKVLGEAVRSMLTGLVTAARETVHAPEVAGERMKDVAEALRQSGADPELVEPLETLPEKIRDILASPETLAALDRAASDLRAAAADLRAEQEAKGRGEA